MSERKKSGETWSGRLLIRDANFLKQKIKTDGVRDVRFKDRSAALAHYVHLGIAAEKQVEAGNSLGDRIIKESQREVVIDSLRPLKEAIDKLTVTMTGFGELQTSSLSQTTRVTRGMQEAVINLAERSRRELENIIIIRSVLFVFLLGIRTNRIQPDEKTPWDKLIAFAHDKARELAVEETNLSDGRDSELVRKLANELFAAVKNFQPGK